MVTWSVETLVLALYVIGIICAAYVAFKAFQHSPAWGAVFLLGPVAFWFLAGYIGFLLAGLAILAVQLWHVRKPYNWKTWGRIYVYMVLCWAGVTAIHARAAGWMFFPFTMADATPVQQAGDPSAPASVEEYLMVEGGRIWYRRTGEGDATPVYLIHGGPGSGSYALKPLEALADERIVVRYDQLGAGRADRATDTTLFAIARFVAELDSLRSALGHQRVHLVGHSWGATLAIEYHRAHADRVASLTLAGPLVSARDWATNTRRMVGTLSEDAQRAIRESEAVGDYDSPDYVAANREFSERFVSRRPSAADHDSTRLGFGAVQYRHMWGPSEFTVLGTLRGYDGTRELRRVRAPALFLVGEYDEADTAAVRRYAGLVRGAEYAVIPDAAHMLTWDNPEETVRLIREFLRRVDQPADTAPVAAP